MCFECVFLGSVFNYCLVIWQVLFICSVFTMSELLNALEKAGKIDSDMVKTVSNFIEQNQLHSAVAYNSSTVSIVVFTYLNS